MQRRLGNLERQLFAYVQMRGDDRLRTGDLIGPLGITAKQERELYTRLARSGLIARVRRGLYLVPRTLPLGGKWTPDPILALNTLIADKDGRYQICGPNAFNRYGFDEQVPIRTYAYNNRMSGERTVGAVDIALIKVADIRLGSTETSTTWEGQVGVYASRVRSLVDAVYDWSRFNSLPRGYRWILDELKKQRVSPDELVDTALCFGNLVSIRRIGVLLGMEGTEERLLRKLERALTPTTRNIPWIPTLPGRGSVNRRWSVTVNGDL